MMQQVLPGPKLDVQFLQQRMVQIILEMLILQFQQIMVLIGTFIQVVSNIINSQLLTIYLQRQAQHMVLELLISMVQVSVRIMHSLI